MLPPIDEAVFNNNPDFERLYKTVTGSLLNTDGSSKSNDSASKKRDTVRDELRKHRLKATKQHLLRRAIIAATTSPKQQQQQQQQQLPQQSQHRRTRSMQQTQQSRTSSLASAPTPEILDLLLLLSPLISNASNMPASSLTLLLSRPPFSNINTHFPALVTTLSGTLSRQAGTLARVLNPHTNPSYVHRSVPTLATSTTALQISLSNSSHALSRSRQRATHDLTRHLSRHTQVLAALIRILESKHGPSARSAELRAADAGLETQTWALAAEALLWDVRRAVYPPEARRALTNYRRHLGDARMRLTDAIRVREAELEDYGVAVIEGYEGDENKERTMREMARVWREMESRLDEVRGDLDRLG
ncbi:uncharacterized protein GGS22DRAFT_98782 [Annulohypoxylon maeteangense]|uniref:uncharacterized protein n=1 Tax=Annulohypoxylon maeteangense TaxID=1927788 RepID=UPI002007F45E|nr:uncharacterized protein GGS22DRAFT_98782 [Annulohypoxylon maeteangense]KAI0880163.1 hypothetical protein GGS22DRAFT_98782 [Annulohypoxylon maeteangense]